jgi:hypothetical protein
MQLLMLISDALRLINAIDIINDPKSEMAQLCLREANAIMDAWRTNTDLAIGIEELSGTFVPGQTRYPVGPGATGPGAIVAVRPMEISAVSYKPTPALSTAIRKIDDPADWQRMTRVTTVSSNWIVAFRYVSDWETGYLDFYPIPSIAEPFLVVCEQPLPQFPSLTTNFTMPPGYLQAFKYALASNMNVYTGTLDGEALTQLNAKAVKYKEDLKLSNFVVPLMSNDLSISPRRHSFYPINLPISSR